MSRGLKTLLTVFVCLGVLATAVFLPMLIMNKSSGFNTKSYPGADLTVSSQGIEKAEFFAKTLKYPDAFKTEYKDEQADIKASVDRLTEFAVSSGVPDFLLNEMSRLQNSANVSNMDYISKEGDRLSLTHIYLEWTGDWSNWLEAYLDRDTMKILYIYVSGRCLVNNDDYAAAYPNCPPPERLGEVYGSYMGYSMDSVTALSDSRENAVEAEYSDGVNTARYKINCIYYGGNMYDIKIAPLS